MGAIQSDGVDSLIRMANSIAENLSQGAGSDVEAAKKVADHLKRFWAGSMKAQLKGYAVGDGKDLHPVAYLALDLL